MAQTTTTANTITFARLELLAMQIDIALRRIGGIPKSFSESILKGVRLKLLSKVSFYGVDYRGLCFCQLDLAIDWEKHLFEVNKGRVTVIVDGRWQDSTALEVDAAIELFIKYQEHNRLSTKCRVHYSPGVDHVHADRVLGLVTASPLHWTKGQIVSNSARVQGLPELAVGIKLVDD